MINEILKFFLTELKRMETHYNSQMKGFGDKIKNQRRQLIHYEKFAKGEKKDEAPCKYKVACKIKDNLIKELRVKLKLLTDIETNLNGEIKVLYEERDRVILDKGVQWDDEELDATDFAHPAWWRGERYSYMMMCERVNEFLDGKGNQGTSHVELEAIKGRIQTLLKNQEQPDTEEAT